MEIDSGRLIQILSMIHRELVVHGDVASTNIKSLNEENSIIFLIEKT